MRTITPSEDERQYSLLEVVTDIAFNVGAFAYGEKLNNLEKVNGSRGLIAWIIEKAQAFEEAYQHVDWGIDEGFGEYIETIDAFTIQALKDKGLLKEERI